MDPSLDNCLMIDELTELEVSSQSLRNTSKLMGQCDSEMIELTDDIIDNYFKALQLVA